MSSTCSSAGRTALLLGALTLPGLAGCVTHEQPAATRTARPLPQHVKARYALSEPVREDYLVPLDNAGRIFRGMLSSGEERCEFHLLMPPKSMRGEGKVPFVICLPILAGGKSIMWFLASSLAERGYATAFCRRSGRAMRPGQRGQDIEKLFHRTIIHNRMVLDWARRQPDLAADQTGVFGISTGGIVGTVLMAVEPQLSAGVLCLAGGDLADIVTKTTEKRIVRWRRWRQREDGLGMAQIRREIDREVMTEPLRFGPHVPTDKVFLVATRLDQVVPMRNQDLLWESLGRPKRLVLPLAHYSAALGVGLILDNADRFLRSRFRAQHALSVARSTTGASQASPDSPGSPSPSHR